MPKAAADFRSHPFDVDRVDVAGKDVGRKVYWKLYAIENLMRIIIHSVLTVQIGKDWWNVVADPDLKKDIAQMMRSYANRPWHSRPGKHEVYYIYLSTLTKIMTSNSAQFQPHIPDVDAWTAQLEQIRRPRNIVGHMNWLTDVDRQRIDVCHADVRQLVAKLAASATVPLIVPPAS
jgi:hypothetical protein